MKRRIIAALCCALVGLLFLAACAPATAVPTPRPGPSSSLFGSLPLHQPGEEVTAGEYTIYLKESRLDGEAGTLELDLKIRNASPKTIDMNWAIQLRDAQGGLVSPSWPPDVPAPQSLEQSDQIAATWSYELPQDAQLESGEAAGSKYEDYRLVFAPHGWSGPVVVYQIVP